MKENSAQPLARVIEASIEELRRLELNNDVRPCTLWYASVLLAYFLGRSHDIESLLRRASCSSDPHDLALQRISELRLALCENTVHLEKIARLQSALEDVSDKIIAGEAQFVLSSAYSILNMKHEARSASEGAAQLLKSSAPRKALRAQLNALVEESRIQPEKRYIADYLYFAKSAQDLNELPTAAICYYNISCEFLKIGAPAASLTYVQRSLDLIDRDLSGRQYYQSLAHRCQVHLELNAKWEARADFENLKASPFPETRDMVAVLTELFPQLRTFTDNPALNESANPNWRERLHIPASIPVGPHEEQLLKALIRGPAGRLELIKEIYGETLSIEHTENRFKNLLNRTRKKLPGLIVIVDGLYQIRLESESILKKNSSGT